ncbi:MAG: hypothetical protein RPT25_06810 [Cycloclasticus sp.]
MSIMNIDIGVDAGVAALLDRIAADLKKKRLGLDKTQGQMAEMAAIGLKSLQKIEAGQSVLCASLFRYMAVLGKLDELKMIFPDPAELTPLEVRALSTRRVRQRASRKSKEKATASALVTWGDSHGS